MFGCVGLKLLDAMMRVYLLSLNLYPSLFRQLNGTMFVMLSRWKNSFTVGHDTGAWTMYDTFEFDLPNVGCCLLVKEWLGEYVSTDFNSHEWIFVMDCVRKLMGYYSTKFANVAFGIAQLAATCHHLRCSFVPFKLFNRLIFVVTSYQLCVSGWRWVRQIGLEAIQNKIK